VALDELALNISLFGLWNADLSRPWWPLLPATDASSAFGFGCCIAPCSPELSRTVGRHACIGDHHIRLQLDSDDPVEKPRSGAELRLPLRQRDFKPMLAIKARRKEHSGALEATGVVLGLRRLSRKQALHRHRGAFLVDAQVVMYALQKGRSSAGTLRHQACQAAALCLACDWKIRYAYLPSESNPADDPSRGVIRCRRPGGQNGRVRIPVKSAIRKQRRKTRGERIVSRFLQDASGWDPSASTHAAVNSSCGF
jgi:hypothetical protein